MKKKISYNEHLDYIFKNTTPYQRMLWLKRALEFWKIFKVRQKLTLSKRKLFKS